jgi:hypothetical protein
MSARGHITGPMICQACPEPHETTDFYVVSNWPDAGRIECRDFYEQRIRREIRETLNPQPRPRISAEA